MTTPGSTRPTARQFLIRRLVVLGILIVLLALAIAGVKSLFQNSPDTEVQPKETPTIQKPKPTKSEVAGPCEDSEIKLSVSVKDGPEFKVGDTPVISADITNLSANSCLRDVGTTANEIWVTNSDGNRVWSSNRCPAVSKPNLVTMNPKSVYRVTVVWPGTRNPKVCGEVAQIIQPGEFSIWAQNAGSTSEPALVTMTAAD